jgi:hypothetical protein
MINALNVEASCNVLVDALPTLITGIAKMKKVADGKHGLQDRKGEQNE